MGSGRDPVWFYPPLVTQAAIKRPIPSAWFFITVAMLFVLADQLDHVKNGSLLNSGLACAELVSLTLSPREEPGDSLGLSVRFRLSNWGNHSVFYPICAGTNFPVGQIVVRTLPSPEWISLSASSDEPVSAVPGIMELNLTWLKLRAGDWVHSEFHVPGESPGEHAYMI